jgi:hypothetical protein
LPTDKFQKNKKLKGNRKKQVAPLSNLGVMRQTTRNPDGFGDNSPVGQLGEWIQQLFERQFERRSLG